MKRPPGSKPVMSGQPAGVASPKNDPARQAAPASVTATKAPPATRGVFRWRGQERQLRPGRQQVDL